jgi:hypothetical protein
VAELPSYDDQGNPNESREQERPPTGGCGKGSGYSQAARSYHGAAVLTPHPEQRGDDATEVHAEAYHEDHGASDLQRMKMDG